MATSPTPSLRSSSPWFERVPDQKRYPPLVGEQHADVVVVGGGIAGVMTAYHLAQAGRSVILLEKNHLATGDTGLTTGFLTHVPDASIAGLLEQYNESFVTQLFAATRAVQQELFRIIGERQIACDFETCSSYWGAYDANNPNVRREWEAMQQSNIATSFVTKSEQPTWPLTEAIKFADEGRLHIRSFIMALAEQLTQNRLRVFEETEVVDFSVGQDVTVYTNNGTVKAKQLILASGAPLAVCSELSSLLVPYITHVVAADFPADVPLSHDLMWDVLDPYFYYRTISPNTMIIGGCDRPASPADRPTDPVTTLQQFITEHFGTGFTLTNHWSGSIFHTADGLPYAFAHPHYNNTVFVAMGFGGNGLIGGSWCGKTVAELALGKTELAHELLALKRTGVTVAAPTPRTPPTALEKKFVRVATLSQLQPNSKLGVTASGRKLVLFRVGDTVHALDNVCTHAGGSLSDGTFSGKTIECPLHGAKFNVITGVVEGPPAVRNAKSYPVRVTGDTIEVEVPARADTAVQPTAPRQRYWKELGWFTLFAIVVWAIEFVYQYYVVLSQERDMALIRTSAITGATFFATALLMSSVFKWWPKLAGYWRTRRHFGVAGFVSICFHVLFVYALLYQWDLSIIYYSLNPLKNPIVFGTLAFPIFFLMAATSTDWAVAKLGTRRWKYIHRLVYIGFALAIAHFLVINPEAWQNIAGYILLVITGLALFGQLYWFLAMSAKRRFKTVGTIFGGLVILLYALLGYHIYLQLKLFFGN